MEIDKKNLIFDFEHIEWKDKSGNKYLFREKNITYAICKDNCINVTRNIDKKTEIINISFDGTKNFSYILGSTELVVYKAEKEYKLSFPKIRNCILDKNENIYILADSIIYKYNQENCKAEKISSSPEGYGLLYLKSADVKELRVVGLAENILLRRETELKLDLKSGKWRTIGIEY